MASFEASGNIHKITDTQQVTDSFKKREVILEIEDGSYKQLVAFEFVQDKCDTAGAFSEGDDVTISFNLRGREYNGKYYTNLRGWKIERI